MAESFIGDALMGLGQGLSGQPFLTNFEKLKQDASQWRDQQNQRLADLQSQQLSNAYTSSYLQSQGVDTSSIMGNTPQARPMLPQAPQQPQVPPGAMMSMASGGYGDASGNMIPQAPQRPQANPTNANGVTMPPPTVTMENGKISVKPMSAYQQVLMQQHQDTLENQYDNRLKTMYSNRSGVLGIAANKVDQAGATRTLINQTYDPSTGNYNINPQQYHELALSLANTLAPNAVASDQKMQALIAKTGEGDINSFLQYMTGSPKNASSQAMFKTLIQSVDREGLYWQDARDKHLSSLKDLAPTGLSQDRINKINKVSFGTDFGQMLDESPDAQPNTKTFFTNGKIYHIPTDQVDEFKKAKGLQ